MNMKFLMLGFVIVFGGCAQVPATTKSVGSAELTQKQIDPSTSGELIASNGEGKLVCTYQKASGSNIRQRVCMSEEDRALMRESSKGVLNRLQQQSIPTSDALPTSGGN